MLVGMGDSGLGDSYELTLAGTPRWGLVGPTTPSPAARVSAGSLYDAGNDRWVLFGGKDPTNHFRNDVQALSTATNAYPLSLQASPSQGGSIQKSSSNVCQDPGSQVTLTAVPATNYGFTGWSGDASGTTNPLTVTMDATPPFISVVPRP